MLTLTTVSDTPILYSFSEYARHRAVRLLSFMVRNLQILGTAYLLSGSTANRQRVFDYYCDLSSAKESLVFSIEIVRYWSSIDSLSPIYYFM